MASVTTGVAGSDGNLVMEYLYTDEYTLASIEANSLSPYTCAVRDSYIFACLDIAAPSTLSLASSDGVDDNVTAISFGATADSHLFGSKDRCDGLLVGDGVVNGFDLIVLMWQQFRVPPYEDIALTHPTVAVHQDAGARCTDGITRSEYLSEYDASAPCVHPRRRLADVASRPSFTVHRHSTLRNQGSWFQLRSHGASHAAVELLLSGVHAGETVALSNDLAPLTNTTEAPAGYEVRFARHDEYCGSSVHQCASIRGIVSTGVAMYHNVISVGQVPTVGREQACGYDLYLYVPGAFECTVDILAGSSSMNGNGGYVLERDVTCDDTPSYACEHAADAHSEAEIALPGAVDSSVTTDGGTDTVALAVALPVSLCILASAVAACVALRRRGGRGTFRPHFRGRHVALRRASQVPTPDPKAVSPEDPLQNDFVGRAGLSA